MMVRFKYWQCIHLMSVMVLLECGFGINRGDHPSDCEPITSPICKIVSPYNFTTFPNALGHLDQSEARKVLDGFDMLAHEFCGHWLPKFLCAAFYTPCPPYPGAPVAPCRSLCEEARKECLDSMNRHWPEWLQCENFPRNQPCITGLEGTGGLVPPRLLQPRGWCGTDDCETLTDPICKQVSPYESTRLPNAHRHYSQSEASKELITFSPLMAHDRKLHLVLCAFYFPFCWSPITKPACRGPCYPCRSLCEHVRRGSERRMRELGLVWPERLRCDKFPDNQPCITGEREKDASETATPGTITAPPPKLAGRTTESSGIELRSTDPATTAAAVTAPPAPSPGSSAVGDVVVSRGAAAGVQAKRVQSALLDWLVTGTGLNEARAELATQQLKLTKLTRKKLAMEYGKLRRRRKNKSRSVRKKSGGIDKWQITII